MTKEALNLALEALEVANSCVDGYYIPKGKTHLPEIELAIIAIKEALANEALDKMAENARELGLDYEPVAWRAWVSKFPQGTGSDWVYVTKPIMKDSIHNQPLYTTPPQRTWVTLTEDEIVLISADCAATHQHTDIHFAKAIEAKLKEKNCSL
jgi:hypothetical protein